MARDRSSREELTGKRSHSSSHGGREIEEDGERRTDKSERSERRERFRESLDRSFREESAERKPHSSSSRKRKEEEERYERKEKKESLRDSVDRDRNYREESAERRIRSSHYREESGDKRSRYSSSHKRKDYDEEDERLDRNEKRDKVKAKDSEKLDRYIREDSAERSLRSFSKRREDEEDEERLDKREKRDRIKESTDPKNYREEFVEKRSHSSTHKRKDHEDGEEKIDKIETKDPLKISVDLERSYYEEPTDRRVSSTSSNKRKEHGDSEEKIDNNETKDPLRVSVDRDRSYYEEPAERRVSSVSSNKRKEHGGEEDRMDKSEKRIRNFDGQKEQSSDESVFEKSRSLNGIGKEERGEKRRFEDQRKDEDPRSSSDVKFEDNNSNGTLDPNENNSVINGFVMEIHKVPRDLSESAILNRPLSPKVSLISTTNENKGVSITRSHEVPGKSSTDGTTSAASKSGSLSLDALAKAKKALQMQKDLAEKLKKIPLLNKSESATPGISSSSTATSSSQVVTNTNPPAASISGIPGLATIPNYQAVKKAHELAAKMGFRQDPQFSSLINLFPGQLPSDVVIQQKPAKAPVLRLDAQGREIDEHGNVISTQKPTNLSTLKVNINKQKKEAFQILKPDLDVDFESNPHFDARMGIDKTKILRPKRMTFQFVEEGKWSKQAELIRFKNQFGEAQAKELRSKQVQLAKAKAELDINPNLIEVSERVTTKERQKDPIPDVEWWDVPFLSSGTYADVTEDKLKIDKITIYVEHPLPIEPPAEPAPPPPQPLKLTKKEQKKLRTQRRLAKEKDRQEMIRQGLLEPPKPKVKMSNLMKVLGVEATQDPTRLEMEIRTAAAERLQAHEDRNIARKLTPAERREKKERKLFDDPSTLETIVSVYRVNNLSHPQTRFKVDVNAQENRLTGCVVIADGITVIAVEGGSKAIKRYRKLMLNRINWAAAVPEEEEGGENPDMPINKCVLVWQGSVAKPSFNRFIIHQCRTEAAARKVFSDAGVSQYWDLAVNFTDEHV